MKRKTIIMLGILILISIPSLIFAGVILSENKIIDFDSEQEARLEALGLTNTVAKEIDCNDTGKRCFEFNGEIIKIRIKECIGRDTSLGTGGCNLGWRDKTNEEVIQRLDYLVEVELSELAEDNSKNIIKIDDRSYEIK